MPSRGKSDRRFLRSNLRLSIADGVFASVMVGAGEAFLPAFALAIGASEISAGLIAVIPVLIGSAFQLMAPRAIQAVGSYRKWVVRLAWMQAASFLPLIVFCFSGKGHLSTFALFAIATLYWSTGLGGGAAWNAWMAHLVPRNMRSRYYARRNHFTQTGVLLGLVISGLALHQAKAQGAELFVFGLIFLVSAIARIASASCLERQSECPSLIQNHVRLHWREALSRLWQGREGAILGFMLFFSMAVNISSPYFNPFMIKRLELSYGSYMLLVATSFMAKILVFAYLSRSAKSLDVLKIMRVGLVGAAFCPFLWILSKNFAYLLLIQVFAGTVWAMYELGAALLLMNALRDHERTSILSLYNFASSVMVLCGTLLGAKLIAFFGETSSTYFVVFALSGCARFAAVMIFDRILRPSETAVPRTAEPAVVGFKSAG